MNFASRSRKVPECTSKLFVWKQRQAIQRKVLWTQIFNEYHVLMPRENTVIEVTALTLDFVNLSRVKVAEALLAEIAPALHKQRADGRYAVNNNQSRISALQAKWRYKCQSS